MKTHSPLVSIHRLKIKCPVCGKKDNCAVSDDRRRAFCRRVRSDKPGRGGWTHILAENFPAGGKIQHAPQPQQEQAKRASADHIAGVLTTLLRRHLTLGERHRVALLARGLSEGEIERNGYRSAPTPDEGDRIARGLSDFGLDGVPGFHQDGGEWRMRDFGDGIFVPIRDAQMLVVGCQIRRDEGSPRYIWFSSAGKPRGTSSGAPVHFARPCLLHGSSEVLITEGALKADICAHFLNQPVIAAAGVSCFGADFAANLKAKFPNLETAYLAFDADFQHNDGVKESLFRLADELQAAGLRAQVRAWPARMGKGIDDYLLTVSKSEGRVAA
jgi:hypothetical protein